jgi:hypothetical protein
VQSSLLDTKSNLTVEVQSDKLEAYKIFKGDILNYFGGIKGDVFQSLIGINTTQSINMSIKIKYIEDHREWKQIDNVYLLETLTTQPSVPVKVNESSSLNVLKEALKATETTSSGLSKLSAVTAPAKPVDKLKGLTKVTNTLKKVELDESKENKEKPKENMTIGSNSISNKVLDKNELTSKQIAAKGKLDFLMGKKPTINEDEINLNLKKIADRKKGENTNKLLAGIGGNSDSLTEKMAKLAIKSEPEDAITKIDKKQLFKRTESIKNASKFAKGSNSNVTNFAEDD